MKEKKYLFKYLFILIFVLILTKQSTLLSYAQQNDTEINDTSDKEIHSDDISENSILIDLDDAGSLCPNVISGNIVGNAESVGADQSGCNVKYYINVSGITLTPKQKACLFSSYDNRVIKLPKLYQKGYTFIGWFIGSVRVNEISKNVSICNGDVSVMAVFAKKQKKVKNSIVSSRSINVTLNPKGGECNKALTYVMTNNTIKLPKLKRKGYKFLGWYTNGYKVNKLNYKMNSCQGKNSINCEALWTPVEYVVSFNKNCKGQGKMDKYHMFYNYKGSLPACSFVNFAPGAHFDKWRINKNVRDDSIEANVPFYPETKLKKTKLKLFAGWIFTNS